MRTTRLGALAVLLGGMGVTGCASQRLAPPTPKVLPDVTGHTALLVDHVGRYELTSEPMRDPGHPGPAVGLSPSIGCYATWHVDAVSQAEVPDAGGLVRLHATLVVDTLRKPILAGYSFGWTRMGPAAWALPPADEPLASRSFECTEGNRPPG